MIFKGERRRKICKGNKTRSLKQRKMAISEVKKDRLGIQGIKHGLDSCNSTAYD